MVPYLTMMLVSKIAVAMAGASVAAAMGGAGWASDWMGAGAGVAVWFGLGRVVEMCAELWRNIMFAKVSSEAEEAVSAPAFMEALWAPPGEGPPAVEVAKRVEDRSARNFLGFMLNHLGGTVGDLAAMGAMAVAVGAGPGFLWAFPATIGVVWLGWMAREWGKELDYDELGGYAKIQACTSELLGKAALAKAYGTEELFMRMRVEASEKQRGELEAYRASGVWLIHASPSLAALAMAGLFASGAHGLESGAASVAGFAAAVAALGAAFARAQQMTYVFEGLSGSLANLNKSLDAYERTGAAGMPSGKRVQPADQKAGKGMLEFKEVVAMRPSMERPAARIGYLRVESGEVLWLVGPSGAGKSTLLGAAMGTLPFDSGEVLWNGVPASGWEELAAWVPQSSEPAPGSLGWNLRLGKEEASDGELWDALRAVGLDERVCAGGGLEAEASGMGLSGGEAQRVSIARAMVSGRPLAAMDEPTSALDAVSEAKVVEAILELARRGAAVVVSSHRLRALPKTARVLCMEAGVAVEEGILGDLIAGDGACAKLWKASEAKEQRPP